MPFGISGRRLLASGALALFLSPPAARAHGIFAEPAADGIGVRARYDDGSPVAFGEARLFAPGAGNRPAFTGLTDRNGFFLFRPDTDGKWKIEIDDGMGHAVTYVVQARAGPTAAPAAEPHRIPEKHGLITGLSLIFGIFGWAAYARLRRKPR